MKKLANVPGFQIEPLASHHDRASFSCGTVALDSYLRRQAGQDSRKRASSIYNLLKSDSAKALGFDALAASSVPLADVPEELTWNIPKYSHAPAILIGRLAVDLTVRGQGFGKALLADALLHRLNLKEMGWNFVLVDAKDENATKFYQANEFIRLASRPGRLALPRSTIEKLA